MQRIKKQEFSITVGSSKFRNLLRLFLTENLQNFAAGCSQSIRKCHFVYKSTQSNFLPQWGEQIWYNQDKEINETTCQFLNRYAFAFSLVSWIFSNHINRFLYNSVKIISNSVKINPIRCFVIAFCLPKILLVYLIFYNNLSPNYWNEKYSQFHLPVKKSLDIFRVL